MVSAITISEIQNKTLLKYAQRADKDKNGVLDKNERISLFAKLESDSAKHDKRASLSNKEIVARSVLSGVLAGGAASALLKSFRNVKSFGVMSVACSVGYLAGNFLNRKIAASKTDNVNNAINELQTLVGEDNDSAVRYYGSKLV